MRNPFEVFGIGDRPTGYFDLNHRDKSGSAHFVHGLRSDQVTQAVRGVLTTYTASSDPLDRLERHIDLKGIEHNLAPSWLGVEGLAAQLAQLDSWRIWERLLEQSGAEIQKKVGEHLNTKRVEHSARLMEGNNHMFMTPAIVLAALGAAVGKNMERATAYTLAVGWEPAVAVGQSFQAPAANSEEFVGRLQQLFRSGTPYSLFPLLIRYKTFHVPEQPKRACPAPTLTEYMMNIFADVLEDPTYKEGKFIPAIDKTLVIPRI